MAVPDLKSATLAVEPGTVFYHLTETAWTQILADVATGYAYFLEQISCSNRGSVAANVSIAIRTADSANSAYDVCSKRSLQLKSQFNAAQGRAHILTEGDSIWAKLEAAGEVHIVIPYTKAHEA